jgi:hypothetical protein
MAEEKYKSVNDFPEKFDTYLVKTEEGCYDFAHFENGNWHKGNVTDGTPEFWAEIPKV